jgi:hypothetical protein
MSELNGTHSHQIHRIFISAPKLTSDRTGLYIIILLFFLLFILIFYLVYNFISYKRYRSLQRKNNPYYYSKKILSNKKKLKNHSQSCEQLVLQTHRLPVRLPISLPIHQNLKYIKIIPPSNQQYPMTNYRVSDL